MTVRKKRRSRLQKPQLHILKTLAPWLALTGPRIAEKAGVGEATLTKHLGSTVRATRLANDKNHFESLLSLKLVKVEQYGTPNRGFVLYTITALGRKRIQKRRKER